MNSDTDDSDDVSGGAGVESGDSSKKVVDIRQKASAAEDKPPTKSDILINYTPEWKDACGRVLAAYRAIRAAKIEAPTYGAQKVRNEIRRFFETREPRLVPLFETNCTHAIMQGFIDGKKPNDLAFYFIDRFLRSLLIQPENDELRQIATSAVETEVRASLSRLFQPSSLIVNAVIGDNARFFAPTLFHRSKDGAQMKRIYFILGALKSGVVDCYLYHFDGEPRALLREPIDPLALRYGYLLLQGNDLMGDLSGLVITLGTDFKTASGSAAGALMMAEYMIYTDGEGSTAMAASGEPPVYMLQTLGFTLDGFRKHHQIDDNELTRIDGVAEEELLAFTAELDKFKGGLLL